MFGPVRLYGPEIAFRTIKKQDRGLKTGSASLVVPVAAPLAFSPIGGSQT